MLQASLSRKESCTQMNYYRTENTVNNAKSGDFLCHRCRKVMFLCSCERLYSNHHKLVYSDWVFFVKSGFVHDRAIKPISNNSPKNETNVFRWQFRFTNFVILLCFSNLANF